MGPPSMVSTIEQLGLNRLSPEDRLSVADAIWDSVAKDIEAAPLPDSHRAELERRLADSIARPDAVTPSEIVKARALAPSFFQPAVNGGPNTRIQAP